MQWNGASHCEFNGKLKETETTSYSELPNGGKAIVEQILVSEEINRSKRAGLWESHSENQVGKLTIWVRSFEIENHNRLHQVDLFHQTIGKPVLMMDVKVLKDKNISRWLDQENLIYH